MREAIATVIPGLLYQRPNFLTWPIERKVKFLERNNIQVVVNLWGKIDSDIEGVMYIVYMMRSDNNLFELNGLLSLVSGFIKAGKPTLVHCEAGVNRSAWFCAKLLQMRLGCTGKEAVEKIKQRLPKSKINPRLIANLLGK